MKIRKSIISMTLMGVMAMGLTAANKASANDYILATASTGGTYYPVGVALATLSKVKLLPKKKFSLSAINSAGSGENIKLLREDEAQFAIIQGLYGVYGRTGTGPLASSGPQKNLRSVTMLWQNVEQFILDKSLVKTGTVADIVNAKGQGAGLGEKNSGTIGSNTNLL